jgi:hypothetical protein
MKRGLTPHGRVVLEQALIMRLAVVRYMRTDEVKTKRGEPSLNCMVGPPYAPERARFSKPQQQRELTTLRGSSVQYMTCIIWADANWATSSSENENSAGVSAAVRVSHQHRHGQQRECQLNVQCRQPEHFKPTTCRYAQLRITIHERASEYSTPTCGKLS